jgi:hypothetical protein
VQREERDKIFSKRVRAGKRTYFFDVRATRSNDYYLTVTESRRYQKDGDFVFEKSKLFIYKEDFNKFVEAMQETVDHIKSELMPDYDFEQHDNEEYYSDDKKPESFPINNDSPESDEFGGSDLKWE